PAPPALEERAHRGPRLDRAEAVQVELGLGPRVEQRVTRIERGMAPSGSLAHAPRRLGLRELDQPSDLREQLARGPRLGDERHAGILPDVLSEVRRWKTAHELHPKDWRLASDDMVHVEPAEL